MLRNVLFVRKFVEKAHESSFPLGDEIQVAHVIGGPRGTKWGTTCISIGPKATDNRGISVCTWASRNIVFRVFAHPGPINKLSISCPSDAKIRYIGTRNASLAIPIWKCQHKNKTAKKNICISRLLDKHGDTITLNHA